MEICLIWTQDRNGAIGKTGTLPPHSAEDLQRLQTLLDGHPVLVGRRTWESLPKRLLAGRQNFVLTRELPSVPGAVACASLTDALSMASVLKPAKFFLMGGPHVYEQGLRIADRLYVARFDAQVEEADVFAPSVDRALFDLRDEIRVPRTGPELLFQEFHRKRQLH